MTESLSNSGSISAQILTDIRSALRSNAENSKRAFYTEEEQEKQAYKDSAQLAREAFYDAEKIISDRTKNSAKNAADIKQQTERTARNQQRNAANQINKAETQEQTATKKIEAKQISLSKSTDTIVNELRRNGLHRTMTVYQVAEKYSVSYMKAREILDEVNRDINGFVREHKLPANSTVSYKV